MVLTQSELLTLLQTEVRILLHLAGKIDRTQLDYRPTPKQRSTIELLKYLAVMGPELVRAAKAGFNREAWMAAAAVADKRDFDQTLAAITGHAETYATLLADWTDADFRVEIDAFDGSTVSRGAFIVSLVLGGCAAYRTQLFMYLKACGREELGTANLWGGVDPPPPAAPAS
jgi:hypothetical protein